MGPALAQQVPVTVELDLDSAQALVLLVGEPLMTLPGTQQLVLFSDERLECGFSIPWSASLVILRLLTDTGRSGDHIS